MMHCQLLRQNRYDDVMVETINGLYKTEVIRHRGPWRSIEEVEFATLECGWIGSTIEDCWMQSDMYRR